MNFKSSWPNRIVLAFAVLAFSSNVLSQAAKPQLPSDQLGLFEAHSDVGIAPLQGAVTLHAATGEYRITGGGANIWGPANAFQPHDPNVLEAPVSSNVSVQKPAPIEQNQNPSDVRSKISIYDLDSKSIRVVYAADKLWEAPNWSPDGKYLLANSGGALYRFALNADEKAQPEKLALDAAYECNNDHGITRDGERLAFSAKHGSSQESRVFVASSEGANPRLLTPNSPSYFHGWSPDGKWLAFVGKRGDYFNIFRVPAGGGSEQRLTSTRVADDGPDYSPDGKWIYINSNRSGGWDIWRFPPEGAGPEDAKAERITNDELEDWFPHPSPDGRWLVFLSFPKGTPGHNVKTNVQLRIIPMPQDAVGKGVAGSIKVLTQIFGGQGTINVNSWSPDSKKFAFVSYELLP
jgi:TolB protein